MAGTVTTLFLCVVGQMVSFEGPQGFATVVGNPAQQIEFYEVWRDYVHPSWREQSQEHWLKEWNRIQVDVFHRQELLYSTNRETRMALAKAIVLRGYTVRFQVTVDPFGKFWIYYNSIAHVLIVVVLAAAVGLWYWRRVKRGTKRV